MPKTTADTSKDKDTSRPRIAKCSTDAFIKSGHPLPLLTAFVEHVRDGTTPPAEILEAISTAFEIVLKGGKTFEEAIGIRKKGRGTWSAITVARKKSQQVFLTYMIHQLTKGCGLTDEKACELVSLDLENQDEIKKYRTEGLLDQYRRTWKRKFIGDSTRVLPDEKLMIIYVYYTRPDLLPHLFYKMSKSKGTP